MRAPRDGASGLIGMTLIACLEPRQPTTGCPCKADQKDIALPSGNKDFRLA
jgi:hypothetical protein